MNLCDMTPQQIMLLATAISGLLAEDATPDEMCILAEVFRIVSDSLFTMSRISVLQNKICNNKSKDDDSNCDPDCTDDIDDDFDEDFDFER